MFYLQLLLHVYSVVLLPLCLLKDLSPLRYTSIAGIVGTLYTAAVMALRYFKNIAQHIEHVLAALVDQSKCVPTVRKFIQISALLLTITAAMHATIQYVIVQTFNRRHMCSCYCNAVIVI
jgi:hypothetical protein